MITRTITYRTDVVKANKGAPFVPVVNDNRFYDDASDDSVAALHKAQELALGLAESFTARGMHTNVIQETTHPSKMAHVSPS